jgi:hypothetical protein
MPPRIQYDSSAPTASIELMITHPLPDYDLIEVEAPVPRDVDPMLASQGFGDLLDETRGILEGALSGGGLEIAQLTGAICRDGQIHRPGIWLVLRDTAGAKGEALSPEARNNVAAVAETLRSRLHLF